MPAEHRAAGSALALLLNRRVRFIGLYRTLAFVPVVISATVQGVLFSFIFDAQFGVANSRAAPRRAPPQPFFADGEPGAAAARARRAVGGHELRAFCAVVYLAALQDIPSDLVEAASIDGARRGGVFRHVTLPALAPGDRLPALWQTVQALQLFDLVYGTTHGRAGASRRTVVVYYVYRSIRELGVRRRGAAALVRGGRRARGDHGRRGASCAAPAGERRWREQAPPAVRPRGTWCWRRSALLLALPLVWMLSARS